MSKHTFYLKGDYNALCHDCGFTFKASQLKRHWTGVHKCTGCWESRHPQDFIRAPNPEARPPWTQPVPAPIFIDSSTTQTPTPPPVNNPPPNPGSGNEEPTPVPGGNDNPPPPQLRLLSDENGNVLTDELNQPLWE